MSHVSTGGGSLGGSFIDLVREALPIFAPLIPGTAANRGQVPQALPGGLSFGNPQPGLQIPGTDVTLGGPGGMVTSTSMALMGAPFRPTMAGAAARTFVVANPVTGKATWFRPAGRPILWSGDLTVCKRVKRIARRARRSGG